MLSLRLRLRLRLPLRPRLRSRLRSRLRAHAICYFRLKTASFAFFTLGFLRVFKEQICVTCASIMP